MKQANADMDVIARRLEKQYPAANMDSGIRLRPMQEEMVSDIRPALVMLGSAVAFVLLIACANVANLLLARASTRVTEISIRAALGASRSRLVRQLLTESVLLALLAGALGIVLSTWAVPALVALTPAALRGFDIIGLNRAVLSFVLVSSLLTGVLFGIVPALYATHPQLGTALRTAERGNTRARGRGALIAAEVAISLILLIGAGLMLKSFARLTSVDPGFNADRLLVFNIGYSSAADPWRATRFYQQLVERLRVLPGVASVSAVSRLPFSGGNSTRDFNLPGSDNKHDGDTRVVTPDYFRTMGIPLLKGRQFSERDSASSPSVAIIGKFIENFGPKNEKLQIVGVVGNIRHTSLEGAPRTEVYQPLGQAQWPSMFFVLRSATADPRTLIPTAQNAVWSVDNNVPLANVRTMHDMIGASVARRKFAMLLLAIFASLAVMLAAIGLYGVMSYSVAQRTREIGIRVALGAQRSDVFHLVINQGMLFVGFGVAAGMIGSLGLTRFISSMLFGVSPNDAATFVSVALGLAFIAFLACWLPARRATQVDPIVALRTE
ncbi:MAG: hypothetical protein DLM52_10285 [Chthoniobacterales bacterium]|nr:MAG: hypothetical protein DLM52_10285 [Chthoniobacterales bacterium]